MAGLQRRKFPAWMTFYAVITILSGFRLMQVTSNGFSDEYFATMMGMVLLVASVMTVIAFSIGFFVSRPAMTTAAALMMQREAAAPDRRLAIDVQIAGLRARGNAASMAVTLILLVATAGMAVARYL